MIKERSTVIPTVYLVLTGGLKYLGSWVEANCNRCFQLMECDDASLFQKWVIQWGDLIDFEIVPVVESKQTAKEVEPSL